jgi:hypothetical protein
MREKQGRKQAERASAKRREQGRHSHRNNASKVMSEFSFVGFFFFFWASASSSLPFSCN